MNKNIDLLSEDVAKEFADTLNKTRTSMEEYLRFDIQDYIKNVIDNLIHKNTLKMLECRIKIQTSSFLLKWYWRKKFVMYYDNVEKLKQKAAK